MALPRGMPGGYQPDPARSHAFAPGRRFAGPRRGLREKIVALTFDDGPDPKRTPLVLDALKAAGAKATFFVLGHKVAKHPDLVRRMVDEGHVVGSHSWSHPANTSPEQARDELDRTHKAIRDACGVDVVWFRPPYGIFTGNLEAYAKVRSYRTILWSVDTQDWKYLDAARTAVIAGERTRRGDVVLMHDIHQSTADAVPVLLKSLARRGVASVTIAELLDPKRTIEGKGSVRAIAPDPPAADPARPRPR
ncbi:MAG: polysaccharide deacetylase family protein [Armatimonadota bacterium]